jgi:hypothetical protein
MTVEEWIVKVERENRIMRAFLLAVALGARRANSESGDVRDGIVGVLACMCAHQ